MPAPSSVIIERDQERATLLQSIAPAPGGQGHLVLIDGPAGIGKTQLLSELRRAAGAGAARAGAAGAGDAMTALGARGRQRERDFPFGVVRQLFEAAVTAPGQRVAALAGAA